MRLRTLLAAAVAAGAIAGCGGDDAAEEPADSSPSTSMSQDAEPEKQQDSTRYGY